MKAATVYLVTNKVNGKTYVGLTRHSLAKRWSEHVAGAKTNRTRSALYSAIRKYGPHSFAMSEFASCLCLETATKIEMAVIQQEQPDYNLTNGGEFTLGKRVLSPEGRARMSQTHAGKTYTEEQRKQISETLKKRYAEDAEFKAKATATVLIARKKIDEAKRIVSLKKAGAEGKMSRQMSPERKAFQFAKMHSPEAIAKMAASKCKMVECTTLATVFDSVSEAAEHLGIHVSTVSKACLGKLKTAHGLKFQFC